MAGERLTRLVLVLFFKGTHYTIDGGGTDCKVQFCVLNSAPLLADIEHRSLKARGTQTSPGPPPVPQRPLPGHLPECKWEASQGLHPQGCSLPRGREVTVATEGHECPGQEGATLFSWEPVACPHLPRSPPVRLQSIPCWGPAGPSHPLLFTSFYSAARGLSELQAKHPQSRRRMLPGPSKHRLWNQQGFWLYHLSPVGLWPHSHRLPKPQPLIC